jgi:formylglycine-generating enzyme required for sulfatase activity/3',5'-cyclic AMP phosphodiesterase CpdA
MQHEQVTLLHLSDVQFGKNHRFAGVDLPGLENPFDTLLARLWEDLVRLRDDHRLAPELVIVTGDLTECGLPSEFRNAREFLEKLTDEHHLNLPRSHVAIIPGNHDVNWNACSAYFAECKADEILPIAPWWPKWRHYRTMFEEFYRGVADVNFSREPPWTLFEVPVLKTVIAGLNSTMIEGHDCQMAGLQSDPKLPRHVGMVSELQLKWFADRLAIRREQGWLRIGAVHHNQQRGCKCDDENLEDADDLDQILGPCLNLLLHGHRHQAHFGWLNQDVRVPILATGSAALQRAALPDETPNQYQVIQLLPRQLRRFGRAYFPARKCFGPDANIGKNDGLAEIGIDFEQVAGVFPSTASPSALPSAFLPLAPATPHDPTPFLRYVKANTEFIDIRGLLVGSGKALRFSIDDIYIPLELTRTTVDHEGRTHSGAETPTQKVAPSEILGHRLVVVLGDPGSGKTTFLRRIAFRLATALLTEDSTTARQELGYEDPPIPLLVPIHKLAEYIAASPAHGGGALFPDLFTWITQYLHEVSQGLSLGLCEADFRHGLQSGKAILLLDGLDEVPSDTERATLVGLIQNLANACEKSRIVVTTRPAAYRGTGPLPGFAEARLAPLEPSVVETFFRDWSQCLYPENPRGAADTLARLLEALRNRAEIRRLARNPVMLTALAVVQWNENRLPEHRADLYESIIGWLSKSRLDRQGRVKPELCVGYLQNLALAMQAHRDGRQVQVARAWAAEKIADGFREVRDPQARIAQAEAFLREEENDSGIVIARGDEIRFWHLTFQEYLAARALAARSDDERNSALYSGQNLYRPEWRETVLLLAGILLKWGPDRLDQMMNCILSAAAGMQFKDRARCAGLLGAVVRDLSPLQYRPADARFDALLAETYAIFDSLSSRSVPIADAIEAAEALGQAGDRRFLAPTEGNWVKMTAGCFMLGAQKVDRRKFGFDPTASHLECPVREVTLPEYYIGRYPVTVQEYTSFVDADGYNKPSWWGNGGFRKWALPDRWEMQTEHPTRPVTGISWYEAMAYAASRGHTLPTEDEWERAARGKEGRRYPWGEEEPSPFLLNYAESRIGHPTPVGVFPRGATPEGVLDMAGNVWEWCRDNDPRSGHLPSEVEEPMKMLRGGCWAADNSAWHCRASNRGVNKAETRVAQFGFRLVRRVGA